MSDLNTAHLREPGLYVVTNADRPEPLVHAAARLGVALVDAPDGGQADLRVVAVGPDADGVLYRLGDRHILVLALNEEGPVDEAWARMERRVEEAGVRGAVARFVVGDPGAWGEEVGWGRLAGTLERLTAIARPDGEFAANRFLSGHWPLAWELWREGEVARRGGLAAAARVREHLRDRAAITEASEVLSDLAGNLGRLRAADTDRATGILVAPCLASWACARGDLRSAGVVRAPSPIEDDLPYPVAAALRAARRRTQHLYRLFKLLEAGEAATAFGAVVVAATCRRVGVSTAHPQWTRGNYGAWVDLALALAGRLPRSDQTGLADPALWVRVRNVNRPLVERRNREYAHDPTRLDDESYAESVRAASADLQELLATLEPLRSIRLGRVEHMRHRRGQPTSVVIDVMQGPNPHFEQEELTVDPGGACDDDLVVVATNALVDLHPYARMIGPPEARTVGIVAGRAASGYRYACRASGVVEVVGDSPSELAGLGGPP